MAIKGNYQNQSLGSKMIS